MYNLKEQTKVLLVGSYYTKPGIFKVQRWFSAYNSANTKQSMIVVRFRISNLPLEFRKAQNLFNISTGVGLPLKINPPTISLYQGLYAHVLVVIDLLNTHLWVGRATKKSL